MTPCGAFTLEVGPALALVLVQSITLGVTALAAYNARRASKRAADTLVRQDQLRASIQNLGATAPEKSENT